MQTTETDNTEFPEGRAEIISTAGEQMTAPRDLIDSIRLNYRLGKSAELSRIGIDQKLVAFARVYLTHWRPDETKEEREKTARQARRAVSTIQKGKPAADKDMDICELIAPMVVSVEPARAVFAAECRARKKDVVKAVQTLPAWQPLKDINGFSAWGLGTIIGEAGDVGDYPGCRHLFKRLGLAPDESYPRGEKKTGRMIPRKARGRIMGIIADPLLRAQWRGEKDEFASHPIGAYGAVYGVKKAYHLAAGKTRGHAHALARRAMIKALLHDVHAAWHGRGLDYRLPE